MTSMVQSFRTLSASDAAAMRARYGRVVTVKAGDTPTSLADRMAFPDHKLERFLLLNCLDSGARLAAGQKVKLVTYCSGDELTVWRSALLVAGFALRMIGNRYNTVVL